MTAAITKTDLTVGGASEGFDARIVSELARGHGGPVLHLARDDRRVATAVRERVLLTVEPEPRLARLAVRSVAEVALLREDRPHVPIEVDRLGLDRLG